MASASIMLLGSPEPGIKFVLRHSRDSLALFLTAKPTAGRRARGGVHSAARPCLTAACTPSLPGEGVWLTLMDVLLLERGLLQKAAGLKLHFIFMSPGHSPVHFCAPCLGVWQTIFTTDALTGREQAALRSLTSTAHRETAVGKTRGVHQPPLCPGGV